MPDRPLDWNAVVIGKGAAVPPKTIPRGAANTVLTQTVVNDEPAFTALNLATMATGVLPIANGGTGSTVGAVAIMQFVGTGVLGNATVFLGNGANATELNIRFRSPVAGLAKTIVSQSSASPGGTETFTYTLRVDNTDTALTFAITGTTGNGTASGSVAVALLDRISVKLVTSLAAATANHQVTLAIQVTGLT